MALRRLWAGEGGAPAPIQLWGKGQCVLVGVSSRSHPSSRRVIQFPPPLLGTRSWIRVWPPSPRREVATAPASSQRAQRSSQHMESDVECGVTTYSE